MIKLLDLIEAKQVGVLYHFTSFYYLHDIIEDNFILKSTIMPFVSFTRNKQMNTDTVSNSVRITIDGNKLSDKYRILPHADTEGGYGRNTTDESEERISLKRYPQGVNIKNCILKIDLLNPLINEPDPEESEPPMWSHYINVRKLMEKNGIKYSIIENYK
jgi:hypothetical protein